VAQAAHALATNRMHLVLSDMQTRTLGPYVAATNWILTSVMCGPVGSRPDPWIAYYSESNAVYGIKTKKSFNPPPPQKKITNPIHRLL
jgi:hypothetical protein